MPHFLPVTWQREVLKVVAVAVEYRARVHEGQNKIGGNRIHESGLFVVR